MRKLAPPPEVTQTISIENLAEQLDVSSWTVRTWLRQGRLPFFKVGRRLLVRMQDVEVLLANNYKPASRPRSG
jgi:excisionase family DNA binding protein